MANSRRFVCVRRALARLALLMLLTAPLGVFSQTTYYPPTDYTPYLPTNDPPPSTIVPSPTPTTSSTHFYVRANDSRPGEPVELLIQFSPQTTMDTGSHVRVLFDAHFLLADNASSMDAEWRMDGTTDDLTSENTYSSSFHSDFRRIQNGYEFTLQPQRTVNAETINHFILGKHGTIHLPNQTGTYGIALQVVNMYGRITESRATKINVAQPINAPLYVPAPFHSAPSLAASVAQQNIPDQAVQAGYEAPLNMLQRMRCDMDNDRVVGYTDVLLMSAYWDGFPNPQIDCYLDGKIDLKDAGLIMTMWNADVPRAPFLPWTVGHPRAQDDIHFSARTHDSSRMESVMKGNRFIVYATLATGVRSIGAATVELKFPADLLSMRGLYTYASVMNIWFHPPQSAGTGRILGTGGTPGGLLGSDMPLFVVEFEAMARGTAVIEIGPATRAVFADKAATEAPVSLGIFTLSIVDRDLPQTILPPLAPTSTFFVAPTSTYLVAPTSTYYLLPSTSTSLLPPTSTQLPPPSVASVAINSKTHPDPAKWYRARDVAISASSVAAGETWQYLLEAFPKGQSTGVSSVIRTNAEESLHSDRPLLEAIPRLADSLGMTEKWQNVKGSDARVRVPRDGVWRLSARRVHDNRSSEMATFFFQIDSTPPKDFKPELKPLVGRDGIRWHAVFPAEDEASGVSSYEVEEAGAKNVQKDSVYLLRDQKPGFHSMKIRAVDAAGNKREKILNGYIPAAQGTKPPPVVEKMLQWLPANVLSELIPAITVVQRATLFVSHFLIGAVMRLRKLI